jgi:hypothetical protein
MSPDFTNGFDVPDDQKERHYDVFEEAVLIVGYLKKLGVLDALAERVRFARRRFGHYEVIEFVAVLFGYAISSERTLEADLTSACSPLPLPTWHSSGETACPRAPCSVAFWHP